MKKIMIASLLLLSLFLFGCIQGNAASDVEKDILASVSSGTGTTTADITSSEIAELNTEIDSVADAMEGFEDTALEDLEIDDDLFS